MANAECSREVVNLTKIISGAKLLVNARVVST